MSVGKYSPTVSDAYRRDQEWWAKNGGGYDNGRDPNSDLDDDGFDSYGYSNDPIDGPGGGVDRAGHKEHEYMIGEWFGSGEHDYHYPLYERIYSEWSVDPETGKPKRN